MIETQNIITQIYVINFSDLQVIYIAEYITVINRLKIEQKPSGTRLAFSFLLKPKITFFHLLLFVLFAEPHVCCHLLSFFVICCHLLYRSLSLVVTRCTTPQSFYERSSNVVM